jgi:hypothetical protein
MISYVWVCVVTLVVTLSKMLAAKDPMSCTRVNVQAAGQTVISLDAPIQAQ